MRVVQQDNMKLVCFGDLLLETVFLLKCVMLYFLKNILVVHRSRVWAQRTLYKALKPFSYTREKHSLGEKTTLLTLF